MLNLLRIRDIDIRLQAANALATFAYNSIDQQLRIRSCGGVMMKSLEKFVDAETEAYQAYGAFQIIILARVIVDVDQVYHTQYSTIYVYHSLGHKMMQDLWTSRRHLCMA